MNKIIPLTVLLSTAIGGIAFSQVKAADWKEENQKRKADWIAMKEKAMAERYSISETDKIEIDISAEKTKYSAFEPVSLKVTLKNVGDAPFRFLMEDLETVYRFQVTTPYGEDAARLASRFSRRSDWSEGYGLSPGQSKSASFILNGMFDMSQGGNYKIVLSKRFRLGKEGRFFTINSNPLTLEVASPGSLTNWH